MNFITVAKTNIKRISIIGSAGRGSDAKLVSATRFAAMVDAADEAVRNAKYDWGSIELCSGGASFSDHVAVALFLRHPEAKLRLFLPCAWVSEPPSYLDTGSADWRVNPGRMSNGYHRLFSAKLGVNSLAQIEQVRGMVGCVIDTSSTGFHSRKLKGGTVRSSHRVHSGQR